MKKVFVQCQFGKPHEWIQKYFNNIATLGKYGYYWYIFTPNFYENVPDNVKIIPMTIDDFNQLCETKLGVNPNMFITEFGTPSHHITDYYIFSGTLFEDWIREFQYWGMTNFDVVYGRIDHFIPDNILAGCDVFSDDVATVNGVFTLWKNNALINQLYKRITNWKDIVLTPFCPWCCNHTGGHKFWGADEVQMTKLLNNSTDVLFKYPQYYPMLAHDRMENHVPTPKLKMQIDGSLWELIRDTGDPEWEHSRPYIGREILLFHFNNTKKWPEL